MKPTNDHPGAESWTDYLDGTVTPDERIDLEVHLERCEQCRDELAGLADTVSAIGALSRVGRPSRDLWPEIEGRIGELPAPGVVDLVERRAKNRAGRQGRRRTERRFTLGQLAAASVVMALLGGGATWGALSLTQDAGQVGPPYRIPSSDIRPASMDMRSLRPTLLESEAAARDLQDLLEQGRGLLDPETVREIEASLAQIEGAITEVREALEDDPASEALYQRLASNLRKRLHLLRSATAAIQAVS